MPGPPIVRPASRTAAPALIGSLLAGGVVALLSVAGAFRPFDLPVGDLFLRLRADTSPSAGPVSRVAAVTLDDASLDALGPLPWPRERLAALVDAIFAQGARGLAVDLVLAEPGSPAANDALAAAFAERPVVLAAALRPDGGWLLPTERFGAASHAAHAEGEVGPDGVVRTVLSTKQRGDVALPALSLAAARLVRPQIHITPGKPIHPDFRLPPGRVPTLGVLELLELTDPLAGPDPLRPGSGPLDDRLVFLGTTATAAADQFLVPTGGSPAPGVLIHASAAASILVPEGAGLVRPVSPLVLITACLALAALAQIVRERAGRLRLAPFLATGAGLALAAWLALAWGGVRLPLVTLAAAFGASALLREATESARAQRETGRLLHLLVAAEGSEAPSRRAAPRGAAHRLELARELQERVVRDRDLRRALLDSLDDGVIRWDADGRVVLANAAATELWGDHPPRREETLAGDPPTPETGDRETLLRRNGRELRLLVHPLTHPPGEALGVLRDVTAERELDDRRREMQRLVSHELKTPLSSIASFGGMLERYRLSGDELARVAGLIRGESERLLDMVTTFLDLERLGSGRWSGERAPLDLAALARDRRELLGAAAAANGLELVLEPCQGDRHACQVLADERLLTRVVDNLVGNAIKYSPAGGRVVLGTSRTADGVELRVADDGPGIPPEALPHLFERFYRVPAPDGDRDGARNGGRKGSAAGDAGRPRAAGSGLGLALVREIAEWHGGCVDVESEPGRGSVFTVRLPALQGEPTAAGGMGTGPPGARGERS